MVLKLTKNPENSRTGMAVTGPTNVATCRTHRHGSSRGRHSGSFSKRPVLGGLQATLRTAVGKQEVTSCHGFVLSVRVPAYQIQKNANRRPGAASQK